jgi:hypothetical protein
MKIGKWQVFNRDGQITKTFFCEESCIILDEGENYIEGDANPQTEYVRSNKICPRPQMKITKKNGSISGLPKGCKLTIGEQSFTIDDGVADISGFSGTIKITRFPYLDMEVSI